jgi:PTH2 family peptidyl-tRNA hydrolase
MAHDGIGPKTFGGRKVIRDAKQVILIRKDLVMSPGKLAAQVAHASLGALLSTKKVTSYNTGWKYEFEFDHNSAMDKWLNGIFTKVTLQVKDETELELFYYKAKDAGLPCSLIVDAGHTELSPNTKTCVGIGPGFIDEIDKITKQLKLYK